VVTPPMCSRRVPSDSTTTRSPLHVETTPTTRSPARPQPSTSRLPIPLHPPRCGKPYRHASAMELNCCVT
jgi:hypothetical protein